METAAVTGLVSEFSGIGDNVAATPNVALASTTTTTTATPFPEDRRSCQPATLQDDLSSHQDRSRFFRTSLPLRKVTEPFTDA